MVYANSRARKETHKEDIMTNNDNVYDIIYNYISRVADSCNIRVYSDGNVCVSFYLDDKHLSLDGHYDYVLSCVKYLYKEFRDKDWEKI